MATTDKGGEISKNLKNLEEIVSWFEKNKDLDIEEGLKKAKDGFTIIQELKKKIEKAENEFKELKKGLEE